MTALILYIIRHDPGPSFTSIDAQVLVLGTLLCFGAVGSFIIAPRMLSRLVLSIRLLLFFALCVSHPTWFDVRILVLSAITFEIGIYEPYPANLFETMTAITASFVAMELIPWFTIGGSPAIISRALLFVLLPVIIGITASHLTHFREALLEATNDNRLLNVAVSQLARSNVMLQDAAFRAAEQSRRSERYRVAREIHDAVGYTLTNLIMMMEAATDLVFDQPEKLQSMMQAARDQAKSGLEETRRSLRELRAYEDPPIKGLAAIEKLVASYDTIGLVRVEAEYGNIPRSFDEEIDSVLFHFVQEGLTNALRHGKATRIAIRFWSDHVGLRVIIRDNGRGSTQITEGIGLSGMRERATRLGGTVRFGNVADGFQTSLELPIAGKEENTHGENPRTPR